MTETNVYLFWRKDRATGCREVLFSGDKITTTLNWETSKNHFSCTDTIATGTHSGMLLGDDFDAVTVEPFQVVPSATCLFIEIRTEVSCQPYCAIYESKSQEMNFTPSCSDAIQVEDRKLSVSDDYYDHLIEEDHYKIPRDCLRDDIYQIPSNLPVPVTPLSAPPTNTKSPLFQPRHLRNYDNKGMQDSKISAPLSESKNSSPIDGQPVAAPRPRKVKEGLDITEEIPSHYDTCKNRKIVKKQASECGTQSAPITSDKLDPIPIRTHKHHLTKRPLTSPVLNNDKAQKECSSPVSECKIVSPLAVIHRPPDEGDIVPLAPEEPAIGVKSGTEMTTQSDEYSNLKLEIFNLNKQLIDSKIENSQVLGGEIVVRQKLEKEVKSGRQECVRLKALLEKVTKDLETNTTLLEEERKTADHIRCEMMELKKKISEIPAKPKILKPKPILPKFIKKV